MADQALSVLRFDGGIGEFVALALAHVADADLLLSVEVSRAAFRGAVETWVHRQAWLDFTNALDELELTGGTQAGEGEREEVERLRRELRDLQGETALLEKAASPSLARSTMPYWSRPLKRCTRRAPGWARRGTPG